MTTVTVLTISTQMIEDFTGRIPTDDELEEIADVLHDVIRDSMTFSDDIEFSVDEVMGGKYKTLEPGSYSTGTLNVDDLTDTFMQLLKEVMPPVAEDFQYELDMNPEDDELKCILDDIIMSLSECTPEGYYFGAHCGDGADFGVWPLEDE